MSVPNFQHFLLPLLQCSSDSADHSIGELCDLVAERLHLSEEDRQELIPGGSQPRYRNRTYWAKLYLTKAGLLEGAGRGHFRITERGRDVLRDAPAAIDLNYLRRFPELVEFLRRRRAVQQETIRMDQATGNDETPEEQLQDSYQSIRDALAIDLLERVRRCTPTFFERLVVDILVAMGYGGSRADAGQAVGRTGDGGVDGVIKQDKLGLESILIQAKRWQNPVGAATVRDFAGSLEGHRAHKGVLITTSRFTQDAVEYVSRIGKRIVLIDGEQLAELMMDHEVGVVETTRYVLKRTDADYFEEM